ncbi:MAG: DUF1499 domain-containing protein [Pseudomonadota bacterium]|nr:DUF1499 domain-containing protein [Pseudomonadota bacterium]
MHRIALPIVTLAGFAAILLLLATGIVYQKGAIDLAQAFSMLRIGALLGIFGAGFTIFFILWQRPQGANLAVIAISAMLGIVAFYMPYREMLLAQRLPAIHDISTDIDEPPAFVTIARVRTAAHNPVAYDGEASVLQRGAYPDIRTVVLPHDTNAVFAAALRAVDELGWRLAEASSEQGRIEATVTSRWFALKDDIVIRLRPAAGDTTEFDMRSQSRLGINDGGANAQHIRRFIVALNDELK